MIGEEFMIQFKLGKRPTQLMKKYPSKTNTIYKYYKLFLLEQIIVELYELTATQSWNRLSQKDYEGFLNTLKRGK